MTQQDEQRFVSRTFDVLKEYFDTERDPRCYHIFFLCGLKTMMNLGQLVKYPVEVFVKHDNLYISFVNIHNNNQPEIIRLYDSEQKEKYKAIMGSLPGGNDNFTDPLDYWKIMGNGLI